MIIVGITGSIGCGKTTIANILRAQGELVFDIDKWVKFLYLKEDFLLKIKKNFPEVFVNDVFYKKSLRNLVFNNNSKLKLLESIVHPFLNKKIKNIIRKNRNNNYVVFLDIALLFEMKWDKYCDYIILADVEKDLQQSRVMSRDNISAEDFNKINNIQISQNEKRKKVDFIINTGVNKNKLKNEVICVLEVINNNAKY